MTNELSESARHCEATRLLQSAQVWDMTIPWLPEYEDVVTLKRCRAAGVAFVSITTSDFPITFDGVLASISRLRRLVEEHSDTMMLCYSPADVGKAESESKLAVGMNVQDCAQLESDLGRIRLLHEAGIRHMALAYNTRNLLADGCAEVSNAGLSNFGRRVVGEMNRVGMVVDCSHTGRRSSLEGIELSERAPIFSHSGVYAVCPHIRNLHDDQIRACAAKGGVIGIVGIGAFLGDPEARGESLFHHLDYVASLVGSEYVGLGTDYVPGMSALWWSRLRSFVDVWPDPTGTQLYEGSCFQPEQLTELVEIMLAHGYPTTAIEGILGGNFRRVYEAADVSGGARQG